MTKEQSTLQKVMQALGMADAQVEEATPEVALAEPEAPVEAPAEEPAPAEEAPAKTVEELIGGLEEKIAALTEMVSKLIVEEVADEPAAEAAPELPAAPMLSKQDLSAVKPFNGAPKEGPSKVNLEAKGNGTTLDAVFAKLYS